MNLSLLVHSRKTHSSHRANKASPQIHLELQPCNRFRVLRSIAEIAPLHRDKYITPPTDVQIQVLTPIPYIKHTGFFEMQ